MRFRTRNGRRARAKVWHGPALGDQHLAVAIADCDQPPDPGVREVNPVEDIRKFLGQTNTHGHQMRTASDRGFHSELYVVVTTV